MKRWLLLCPLVLLAGCMKPKPLPIYGQVPEFHLTAQDGRPFDSQMLDGRVWVADFIYTTCTGPCPMMSSYMRRVQNTTEIALVSFTVDPAHDTPQVLAAYSKHFTADPARWYFLTGDKASLNTIGVADFKLNSVDGSLVHSTRFALVDQHQRIRGYYTSTDDGFLQRLQHDIRQLEKYPS